MTKDSLKQMKKDIRDGLVTYMGKKDHGKSLSTYKTYVSDSNYLINPSILFSIFSQSFACIIEFERR